MRLFPLLACALTVTTTPLAAQDDDGDRDIPGLREVPDRGAAGEGEDEGHGWGQNRASRKPTFWISGGIGAAGLAVRMNDSPLAYSPRHTVPSFSLGAGAMPDPHVQLGLELFSWFNFTGQQTVESVVMLMLGGRFHPVPGSGFFVRGSGGFGIYHLEWEDSWLEDWFGDDYCDCDAPIEADVGLAWSVGAGYQAPVGRHLRLGPTVELLHMRVGGPGGYQQRIVNVGLTLTFDGND